MSALLEDLEGMRNKLSAAISWNFGSVGNDPVCNARMEDVQRLEEKLKAENLAEFKHYQNKYY
jgi:hypothetical protein